MSENIDINVGIIKEEISINAANNIVEVNISTAPVTIINPQNYDLSQFTNTSPNPFVRASGLSSYVPISRTLTINGVTQDLSADRTFTISTGITIGSTAIASGVVGRVLFEGAGNVVQESSSLFWDNTGGNLSLGTSIPSSYANLTTLTINGTNGSVIDFKSGNTLYGEIYCLVNEIRFDAIGTNGILKFLTNSVEKMRVAPTTGNVLINTTTDAGFRLDVNGTARVSGNSFFCTGAATGGNGIGIGTTSLGTIDINQRILVLNASKYPGYTLGTNTGATKAFFSINGDTNNAGIGTETNSALHFFSNSIERMRLFSTGNVGINTTTDAGYRLDVNGTARVNNIFYVTNPSYTGNIRIESINNMVQRIAGGNSENITFGAGGNTININATETYVSGSFLGSGFWMQNNGATVLGAQAMAASSALLDIRSTTRGFLPPRMTTTQINAITSPAEGLMVYNTTISHVCVYQAGSWVKLSHSPM